MLILIYPNSLCYSTVLFDNDDFCKIFCKNHHCAKTYKTYHIVSVDIDSNINDTFRTLFTWDAHHGYIMKKLQAKASVTALLKTTDFQMLQSMSIVSSLLRQLSSRERNFEK